MAFSLRRGLRSLIQGSTPESPPSGERGLFPTAAGWSDLTSAGVARAIGLVGDFVDTTSTQSGIAGAKTWTGNAAFNAQVTLNGAIRVNVGTQTQGATLSNTPAAIQICSASAGAFTLNLPTAALANVIIEFVKDSADTSFNSVTIAGSINGQTNILLSHPGQVIRLQQTATTGVWRLLYNSHGLYTHFLPNTVVNTASEVSAIGSAKGYGSLLLPAGFWYPGRRIYLDLAGTYQTPAFPNDVTVRVKMGGSAILASTLITASIFTANQTASPLQGRAVIECESVSAGVAKLKCDAALGFRMGATEARVPFSTASTLGSPTSLVDWNVATAGTIDVTEQWTNAQAGQGTSIATGRLSEAA